MNYSLQDLFNAVNLAATTAVTVYTSTAALEAQAKGETESVTVAGEIAEQFNVLDGFDWGINKAEPDNEDDCNFVLIINGEETKRFELTPDLWEAGSQRKIIGAGLALSAAYAAFYQDSVLTQR